MPQGRIRGMPNPTPLGLLSDDVDEFAESMKCKLIKKRNYGYWDCPDISPMFLFQRMADEFAELAAAMEPVNLLNIKKEEAAPILEEAVDVANFAMMLHTVVKRRAK